MSHFRRRNKKAAVIIKIIAAVLIIFFGVKIIDSAVRPVITEAVLIKGKHEAEKMIYSTALAKLRELRPQYSSFVKISRTDNGSVTTLETDTNSISIVASEISLSVIEHLGEIEEQEFSIHSGTLTGKSFLAGRGPKVKFRIETGGRLTSDIESTFQSAGINQTLHSISLKMNITVTVFVPGFITSGSADVTLPLAQTVIVGVVPESFADLSLLSKTFSTE